MTNINMLSTESKLRACLTTESPASKYIVPVLRIEGPGFDSEPDYGPASLLPSGITAAEFVRRFAEGDIDPEEEPSTMLPCTSEGLAAAKRFMAQWPDGRRFPQFSRLYE